MKRNFEVKSQADLVRYTEHLHWSKKGSASAGNAKLFTRWVGAETPIKKALNELVVADYLNYREIELGNSGSAINRHIAAISKLVSVALRLGLIDRAPYIERRQENPHRERVFTREEEALLVAQAVDWGYYLEAQLFIFLVDTGCRLGEAEKILWTDLLDNGLLEIRAAIAKSDKARLVGATKRVKDIFANPSTAKGPFECLNRSQLRTLWSKLRQHFDWLNSDAVIHSFRHTCASRLVQKTGYLDPVTRWLGHSSPQMTMRYAKYAPENYKELAQLLEV